MKYILNTTVLEEAEKRISFIFEEFENIGVSFSGGKDSVALLDLILKEAKKRDRKVHVFHLDVEIEFLATVDVVRNAMSNELVIPHWIQCDCREIETSMDTKIIIWEKNKEWVREKEPNAIKDYPFKRTKNKGDVLCRFYTHEFKDAPFAIFTGMTTDESFARHTALTTRDIYKGKTWGCRLSAGQYTFSPLYDWKTSDVWKYIQENKVMYSKAYDYMFTAQFKERFMRTGGLLGNDNNIEKIIIMEEYEPENYARIIKRIPQLHFVRTETEWVNSLPYRFKNWKEYFYYLSYHDIIKPSVEKRVSELEGKGEIKESVYEDYCYKNLNGI